MTTTSATDLLPLLEGEHRELSEAAQWFVRVHDEQATTEDLAAWQQWQCGNEARRLAFAKVEQLWNALGRVPAATWSDPKGAGADVATKPGSARRRSLWRRGVACCAILAMIAASMLWPFGMRMTALPDTAAVQTGAGAHQLYRLTDGSRLEVGASTHLIVQFTPAQRTLRIDSGEFYVEVAHNPNRPFVVRAGAGTIRAVGTAFNVLQLQDRVAVTVIEGRVQVETAFGSGPPSEAQSRPPPAPLLVHAGQRVAYERTVEALESLDTAVVTSWRSGRQQYLHEPLKRVIPDVARYSRQKILLADPAVGELIFTGAVLDSEIGDWITSLGRVFPLQITRLDDHTVVLSSLTPTKP